MHAWKIYGEHTHLAVDYNIFRKIYTGLILCIFPQCVKLCMKRFISVSL